MKKNFNNTQFKWTFESILDNIPTIGTRLYFSAEINSNNFQNSIKDE
jgi:hypothetical protein